MDEEILTGTPEAVRPASVVAYPPSYDALLESGYDVRLTVFKGVGHDGPVPGSLAFEALVREILAAAPGG